MRNPKSIFWAVAENGQADLAKNFQSLFIGFVDQAGLVDAV
jgi:hypothetical protein